ncbi:MAG TPA: amidohydrolase family protein [Gemmatimonadaceae bacterium]|nr:amidohydrolase family protein [Gemmatimonadaceae bacterium]
MRKIFCLVALCATGSVAGAQQTPAVVVLRHANLADGARGAIATNAALVIRNGQIAQIESEPFTPPAGATVIDVGGRYVVPGLIDAHTHISTLANARRALESGVTTVRSASTNNYQDVSLRELARQGAIPGPDVVAAGVFVTPELGETMLADPKLGAFRDGVTSEAALRAVVRVNLEHRVDVIKTRGTERAGLPNTDPRKQSYSEQQLAWIVDEATKGGVPVMAHAHGDEGAYAAVKAGVRSIEHGTYLSDSTLALMRQRGTFLVPTYITVVDLTRSGGDYDDPILTLRGAHMLPRLGETVQRAHRMGVKIVTGADTQYGPESLSRVSGEVMSLVELGLTPVEALRSATTVAADLLGLGGKTGAIQAGLEADLIVVEKNPLQDARALADVLVVISNGRVALNRLPFAK